MALIVQQDPHSKKYVICWGYTDEQWIKTFDRLEYSAFYDYRIRQYGFKNARKLNDIVRKNNGTAKSYGGPAWGCPHQWDWLFNQEADAQKAVNELNAIISIHELLYPLTAVS